MDIRALLSGGDLRSIGHVDAVVAFVGNNPDRFSELMTGLTDDRPVVRMRSADAADIVHVLTRWIEIETSNIVIVNSLQALFDLSIVHPRFRDEVVALLEANLESGSPAVKSRCKKCLRNV